MSRIESRPSKREMGEYIFFVDLELSAAESQAAESGAATGLEDALAELRPLCEHLALFGTYPLTVVV
jgi:prephenate dehydratase